MLVHLIHIISVRTFNRMSNSENLSVYLEYSIFSRLFHFLAFPSNSIHGHSRYNNIFSSIVILRHNLSPYIFGIFNWILSNENKEFRENRSFIHQVLNVIMDENLRHHWLQHFSLINLFWIDETHFNGINFFGNVIYRLWFDGGKNETDKSKELFNYLLLPIHAYGFNNSPSFNESISVHHVTDELKRISNGH